MNPTTSGYAPAPHFATTRAPTAARKSKLSLGSACRVWRIDRSVVINGELFADTDVSIDGRFSGQLSVAGHRLATGACSHVTADAIAAVVVIRGRFVGNITATQSVTVTKTASVEGNIRAPRVKLEPGALLEGSVESDATK